MLSLFGSRKTPDQAFWHWFVKHEAMLLEFEADRDRVFALLAKKLQEVHPDLTFELGPKQTKREFVISAGGIKAAFPAVVALAKAAPALSQWQVIAFRPRRDFQTTQIELDEVTVDTSEVQFSLLEDGKTAGLYLFLPGFQQGDMNLTQIGYLLLDHYLGEYDVEMGLGLIKMLNPADNESAKRYPLTELPRLFDQVIAQLDPASGLKH